MAEKRGSTEPGTPLDRAVGALLGLAAGDALGTTLEFTARDSHPRHTEMIGGGPFGLKPGEWTDDTSMAPALADTWCTGPSYRRRWRDVAQAATARCCGCASAALLGFLG
jgi:ADP-ribosylglycohydrolase